jgi:hypothetical protein
MLLFLIPSGKLNVVVDVTLSLGRISKKVVAEGDLVRRSAS